MSKKQDDTTNPETQDQQAPSSDAAATLREIESRMTEITAALQRERADAMNLRRHYDARLASLDVVIKAKVVRSFLPVIDNFERALKHVPADLADNDYVKGIQGIVKQFDKVLQDLGVQKIATVDHPFDPKYHEAVTMEEGDGTEEVVVEELQSGYILGDEVIRHAMVKVATR